MSLFKFKVAKNDQVLVYNNLTNSIETEDGTSFGLPLLDMSDIEDQYGKLTKSKAPTKLKLILGHGCNYNCGYCMQKDIGNPDERASNSLTPMLIKSIRRHMDLSELTRFELWGGETLLYWKDIVPLMQEFDREGIEWYIPTNGTLLKDKHIDFFLTLKGKVSIGISHDGPGHIENRGPEFLHRKVEIFKRIQREAYPRIQFSFNAVISRSNYDLFAINDFFRNFMVDNGIIPVSVMYELGRVYDKTMSQNSTHHVIMGDDLPKYKKILDDYLQAHIDQVKAGGQGNLLTTSLFHVGMGVLPYAETLRQQSISIVKTSCGVDDTKLISMDMMGNIRTCQNTDESFISGNVMDIKGVKLKKVTFARESGCQQCGNYRICKSSCPLDLGDDVFRVNCAVEKIHYAAIRTAAIKLLLDSDIEWIS